MKIHIGQLFFSEKEKPLLETGEINVSIFNYASGVEAVRICSEQSEYLNAIKESHIYDPELVLWFKEDRPVSDNLCYSVLQKNDSEAFFVSYEPRSLDHAIRWISINPDFRAAGILLPATSETEGFLKEEEKGNIKYLKEGESVEFVYNTGMMTGSELQSLFKQLNYGRG
jgi:hypothetical protein